MEGQRRYGGFRSRNVFKLLNLSPERATKEYKYGTSGPGRRREEPRESLVKKKTARTTFSSTPNIRKLICFYCRELIHFWCSGHDDKHVIKTAGKYLRLHSVWSVTTPHSSYHSTYSVLLLIPISFGYNVSSFYINI